jgi:hypothetical protein
VILCTGILSTVAELILGLCTIQSAQVKRM